MFLNCFFNITIVKREIFCEVRCLNCGEWIDSKLKFGSAKAFFATATWGNIQTCTLCGKLTPMNKDNMRFGERREDGGVFYIEGKDTL